MEASCGGRHERAVRATLKAAIWPERSVRARESCSEPVPWERYAHAAPSLVPFRSWSVKELLEYNVKEGCRHR